MTHHHSCLHEVVLNHSWWGGQVSSSSKWTNYFSVIRHCGGMVVHLDLLSTGVDTGTAAVELAG